MPAVSVRNVRQQRLSAIRRRWDQIHSLGDMSRSDNETEHQRDGFVGTVKNITKSLRYELLYQIETVGPGCMYLVAILVALVLFLYTFG